MKGINPTKALSHRRFVKNDLHKLKFMIDFSTELPEFFVVRKFEDVQENLDICHYVSSKTPEKVVGSTLVL